MAGSGGLPRVVAHADWGVGTAKRWVAVAVLGADGRYRALAPRPVGPEGPVLERLGVAPDAPRSGVVLGFDFPIGLPRAYARRVGIADFRTTLGGFGRGEWAAFYSVAKTAAEIGLYRPFYPLRPGSKGERSRRHLCDACTRAAGRRRGGAPLGGLDPRLGGHGRLGRRALTRGLAHWWA